MMDSKRGRIETLEPTDALTGECSRGAVHAMPNGDFQIQANCVG